MAEDGSAIVAIDPWLKPYQHFLQRRYSTFLKHKKDIVHVAGAVKNFAMRYHDLGLRRTPHGVEYREWSPNVRAMSLVGDFNYWNREANPMTKGPGGWWTVTVPDIPNMSRVKVHVVTEWGEEFDRIPTAIRATQQIPKSPVLDGLYYEPKPFVFKHPHPPKPRALHIYECHVGISSEEGKIASYGDFTSRLPYIAECGYNAIQLMAVMEHAYYASFGYHVTNFFAPSSRFGPPEDLKTLIDTAHGLGIRVLLDLVHAHASKNVLDGLNKFDGTDNLYFHSGERGIHSLWDSRMFDYGRHEVQEFLLSNLRYWIDEFGFDGFRFDGITAMMYHHRGIATGFSGGYHEYFGDQVDEDAIAYLMLANEMLHECYPFVITVAEDVSGMPALCLPVSDGGLGFDYRLSMGIPDMWETMVKKPRSQTMMQDESWEMGKMVWVLTNRRYKEPVISYAESHDQALVGSKTIAFWLMDEAMYTSMSILSPPSLVVDRGIALHKMIRLVTLGLGGQGYLNFMGNEFGHPEWIDFPRAGNNDSFHYARRQWHLVEDGLLKYQGLGKFDRAMLDLETAEEWLDKEVTYVSAQHEGDKVIVFERGGLLFAFNFHPTQSYTDYRIGTGISARYRIVLDSDAPSFGGFSRLSHDTDFYTESLAQNKRPYSMLVYLPTRTGIVFKPVELLHQPPADVSDSKPEMEQSAHTDAEPESQQK